MAGKIDENGEQYWLSVAETVKPLKGKRRVTAVSAAPKKGTGSEKAIAEKSTAPSKSSPVKPPPPQIAKPRLKPANLDSKDYGGISRADAQRMKTGQISLAEKIDLHGQNYAEAHENVRNFIIAATRPCTILVITGKGIAGKGVIRQNLPKWLNQDPINELVVAFCKAQPKDGGDGAFYLRLRP